MTPFHTTQVFVAGAVCTPAAGQLVSLDLLSQFAPAGSASTFRDALIAALAPFPGAKFTADSEITVGRVAGAPNQIRFFRERHFKVAALPGCSDLVDPSSDSFDFLGDDDYGVVT